MVDFGIRAPRRHELIDVKHLSEVSKLFQFINEDIGIKFLSEFMNWSRPVTNIDINPWDGERKATATTIYKQSVDDISCITNAVIEAKLTCKSKDSILSEFQNAVNLWQVSKGADLGKLACNIVTGLINRHPMGIEWEKCFLPYMLSRKKRYAGRKWAGNPNTGVFFL